MLWIFASYHCMQFQEKLMNQTRGNGQKPTFRPEFWHFWPKIGLLIFPPRNLTPSLTRYYGQLSSCTILEKTNDPILIKLSDGWIDRGTGGKNGFIGYCPIKVELPTSTRNYSNYSWYLKKKKIKTLYMKIWFPGWQKTRVWPKKLRFVKIAVFTWNTF